MKSAFFLPEVLPARLNPIGHLRRITELWRVNLLHCPFLRSDRIKKPFARCAEGVAVPTSVGRQHGFVRSRKPRAIVRMIPPCAGRRHTAFLEDGTDCRNGVRWARLEASRCKHTGNLLHRSERPSCELGT